MDIDTYVKALRKLPREWRAAEANLLQTNIAFDKIIAVHPELAPIYWNGTEWKNLIGGLPPKVSSFFQPRLFFKGK